VVEVDVTGLNAIGDSVHVRDVNLGDKVRILNDQDMLLVHVVPVALAVTDEELAAETGAAEPELIRREREDEEEE